MRVEPPPAEAVRRVLALPTVGDKTFDWSQHDVFTIPSWAFASHRAISGDADLFMVSDKVVFERLDVLREEMR